MAKRGHKTHDLGFEFDYSGEDEDRGNFAKCSAIDLQAPSLKHIHFQSRVEAKIAKAMFSMIGDFKNIKELLDDVDKDAARKKASEGGGGDILELLAGSMDDEKYADFVVYILKFLTDTDMAKIAGTNIRMTDDLWVLVGNEGGNEAIKAVVNDFLSFFDAMGRNKTAKNTRSQKTNGQTSYMTPVSPTEAH